MKPNIGKMERLLRVILGIYAMLLGFLFVRHAVGTLIGVLGLVALVTGATGWCGLYALLKRPPVDVEE